MKNKLITLCSLFIFGTVCRAQSVKPIPKDTSYTTRSVYLKIKKDFPYAIPVPDSLPDNVNAYRDQIYAQVPNSPFGKRELKLDVFSPKNANKLPALIMIHGGGWRSGNKSMEVPLAQLIAARGFVTVAVEYQLSLEAPYPAAVHNIKAAIRWIKSNANRYGIDTNKIAISGTSAGGQLAALIGTTNNIRMLEGTLGSVGTTSTIHAIIDIDGVINFLAPSSLNLPRKSDSADIAWLGGNYLQQPEIWKEASAANWANEKTVPMLFINSGFSRFHAGQDELIGSLKEWGVYHEVYQFNVKIHPFWLFHPWADETANYMVSFLQKVFKTK